MKLLAIDSSAKSASVAVFDGDRLISECFVNNALTHSKTLIPMVDYSLSQADLKISDIDNFAVNIGPGSFTGIRIGVSAVKGLSFGKNKNCYGASTLESMAYNFLDEDCIVVSCMDARCNQVYNSIFEINNSHVNRVCEDRAIPINDLRDDFKSFSDKKIYLCGDGAKLVFDYFKSEFELVLPKENRLYQRAYSVGLCALDKQDFSDSFDLEPSYLRLAQAERELKIKQQEAKNDSIR